MADANFGERLRSLRKNLGKSQAEAAQEIAEQFSENVRISQKTLSVLEQRETSPRGEVLEILARYYKVPIAYFFETSERSELDAAKQYLKSLVKRPMHNAPIQAQSTEHRSENDDVAASLHNLQVWQPDYDEDEYLDT